MPKWTVRVPDDVAGEFRAFCQVQGVSIQGVLEATARNTGEMFRAQGSVPVEEWFPGEPAARREWLRFVQLARTLDAQKRSRE